MSDIIKCIFLILAIAGTLVAAIRIKRSVSDETLKLLVYGSLAISSLLLSVATLSNSDIVFFAYITVITASLVWFWTMFIRSIVKDIEDRHRKDGNTRVGSDN